MIYLSSVSYTTLPLQTLYYYHKEEVFGQKQDQEKDTQSQGPNPCTTYDPENRVITVTCKHATLTDIDNQLKDPSILHKETYDGIWLLNAGIVINKGAILTIDSKDTKWLKIVAEGGKDANKERGEEGDKQLLLTI